MLREKTGITLIALVITIIVLLILAGVTIVTLTGENGILMKANEAREKNLIGQEKDEIAIAYNGAMAENSEIGDVIAEDLNTQFEKNGTTATASGSNPITVVFESGREYTIDSNGSISEPIISNIVATIKIEGTKVTQEEVIANYIPTGFYYVGGTLDEGIVISDNSADAEKGAESTELQGNQFVWVPVDKNPKIKIHVTSKEENITNITLIDPYGDKILTLNNDLGKSYMNENVVPTINGPYALIVTTASEKKTMILGVHSLYEVDTFKDLIAIKDGNSIEEQTRTMIQEYEKMAIEQGYDTIEKMLEAEGISLEEMGFSSVEEFILSIILANSSMEHYTEEENNYSKEVNANGGFYIGRYEASYENGNVASKVSKVANDSSRLENGKLWNWITQSTALSTTQNMYHMVENKNFTISLLTGSAWDRTLGWLYGTKTATEIVGNSNSWGNYSDDTLTPNETSLVNTGYYAETEANHIFDLAGNVSEWVTEPYGSRYRVVRGR